MRISITWVHPDLKLVPPSGAGAQPDDAPRTTPTRDESDGAVLGQAENQPHTPPFPFEKLPGKIQAEILKLILHKEGHVIHCLSRLDPFVPPASFSSEEELGDYRSGLTKRFFWGKRECNITHDGFDPNEVVSLLSVSKRMFFLGVHIFYGSNTFAFSSLGEFGR
ncbi:hypothetical protein VTK56DRAFT_9678 [Thermocarpiscus australiensis]